ncbi:MAG: 2-oxoglutarate and iron-dependent oxygenase domain-containing protein [Ilumatobacteraceae bacterium]
MSEPFADFPAIDLQRWRSGTPAERAEVAAAVDHALRHTGFLLLVGHGIDPALPARVRETCGAFFHLDEATKAPYRSRPGRPGWAPSGVEANAYASGEASPPDLKETLAFAPPDPGLTMVSTEGPREMPNMYPAEVPGMADAVDAYMRAGAAVAFDLYAVLEAAIGAPPGTFAASCDRPAHSMNVTWYPPRDAIGEPADGQYRIGPHTDFGTITLLDRQPGVSGLQVLSSDGEWLDAPYVPGSLTINVGDLIARWSGGRWRSNLHRILAPSPDAPAEELISLVLFMEPNVGAIVAPLPPPMGGGAESKPIDALEWVTQKMRDITVPG